MSDAILVLNAGSSSLKFAVFLDPPVPLVRGQVEAIELFVYRVTRELGSLVAALGGLDALVFTGSIGERSAAIRARVCRAAAWLDLEFDAAANEVGGPRLSPSTRRVSAWVIPTNEELMIAQHTRCVLRGSKF
jgi:acetate kinase